MSFFKKINLFHVVLALVVPVLLLALWELVTRQGWVNTSVVPAPSEIAKTWLEWLENGKYQAFFLISFYRFLSGFCIGTFFGICLGVLMGIFPAVNAAFVSLVGVLRPIPMIGWIPIAILLMGIGETPKILVIGVGAFWGVFVGTLDGILGVDKKYLEVSRVLEKSKWVTICKVVLPVAFPSILSGMRQGFSASWKGVVAAEMIATSSGVGFMISYAREITRPDIMFIGLATIGMVGLFLDLVVLYIQRRVMIWYANQSD